MKSQSTRSQKTNNNNYYYYSEKFPIYVHVCTMYLNQSINQSAKQSIKQAINQSISQSININLIWHPFKILTQRYKPHDIVCFKHLTKALCKLRLRSVYAYLSNHCLQWLKVKK